MPNGNKYSPRYGDSWAVIVGINNYITAPPLGYACNDASVIAEQLTNNFGFPGNRVKLLLDSEATLGNIRSAMAHLARSTLGDDRVILFYAGHGHTIGGNRRETGFLVPVDGDPQDIATLLPWDELVVDGNLIAAKHILYIMDACYSGLISTRKLAPGSTRIARDMLTRYSRQYLTAGKANQVVADCGGPRNGHSMFTGHLLDAMDGAVATADGIVTANAVIAYVYDRVAKDPRSDQTPHYGWLEGDGDLFFTDPKIDAGPTTQKEADDILVVVPSDLQAPAEEAQAPLLDQLKEYLPEPRHRIRLDDLVKRELRAAQQRLGEDHFPVQGQFTKADFALRLEKYEAAMRDVLRMSVLLGRWTDDDQQAVIRQIVNSLAGHIEAKGGLAVYLGMRWFPMLLAMYAGGIGAVEGENFKSLRTLFSAQVPDGRRGGSIAVVTATVDAMLDVERTDVFTTLPGHERKYVPRSEYLFVRMQPIAEDMLFLGSRYERLFDRFEVFAALSYADTTDESWGPLGRYAWKHAGRSGEKDPFSELFEEAKREGDRWAPTRAGMFGGSTQRFLKIAEGFKTNLLARLSWH